VLSPDSRAILRDLLKPPAGSQLAQAVGTTFTVDLTAALAIPLSFAARDLGETPDPIGIMEAVRSSAEYIDVFYQAGQAAVPLQASDVFAFLEPVLHPVKAPRAGHLFHPKVWFLKFIAPDGERSYRFVCSTRNLTSDRSWDAVISLDGTAGRRDANNKPLRQFLRALVDMPTSPLTSTRRERLLELAEEAHRVDWELPDKAFELAFHPLGIGQSSSRPDFAGYRRLVIAPFVDPDGLKTVAPPTARGSVLVARAEHLDRLPPQPSDVELRVLSVLAELEDDRLAGELTGLHAKMTIVERGNRSHLFLGSANATRAAYDGNVEFLVEVVRGSSFGVAAHLDVESGLGGLLEEYTPQAAVVDPDEEARYRLENLLRSMAERQWSVSVTPRDTGYDLQVTTGTPLPTTEARLTIELLTRRGEAVEVTASSTVDVTFPDVSLADITPFVVLAATERDLRATSVVPAQLIGDPEDRLDAVLARQVDSPEKFLRFLLLLLGLTGGDALLAVGNETTASGSWMSGKAAVFELLARALADNRGSLVDLARIVDRLQQTEEGRAVMPQGFLALWTTVVKAQGMVEATA
jgi:hypothetical protein